MAKPVTAEDMLGLFRSTNQIHHLWNMHPVMLRTLLPALEPHEAVALTEDILDAEFVELEEDDAVDGRA